MYDVIIRMASQTASTSDMICKAKKSMSVTTTTISYMVCVDSMMLMVCCQNSIVMLIARYMVRGPFIRMVCCSIASYMIWVRRFISYDAYHTYYSTSSSLTSFLFSIVSYCPLSYLQQDHLLVLCPMVQDLSSTQANPSVHQLHLIALLSQLCL